MLYPPLARLSHDKKLALALGALFIAFASPATLCAVSLAPTLFGSSGSVAPSFAHMAAAAFLIFAPVCLAQGFLFALASDEFKSAGRTYAWDAFGSAAAGAVCLFAVGRVSDDLLNAGLCAVSCLLAAAFFRGAKGKAAALACLPLCAFAALYFPPEARGLIYAGRGFERAVSVKSGEASVFSASGAHGAVLLNGSVYADFDDPALDEARLFFVLAGGRGASGLVAVGGSAAQLCGAVEALGAIVPERIYYVIEDEKLLELEKNRMPKRLRRILDEKITVAIKDARSFFKEAGDGRLKRFAVWLRAGDPLSVAQNRLLTSRFFEIAADAVGREGSVHFSLSESGGYMSPLKKSYVEGLARTAAAAFGFEKAAYAPLDGWFVSVKKSPLTPEEAEEALIALESAKAPLTRISRALLDEAAVKTKFAAVSQDKVKEPYNTDDRPAASVAAAALASGSQAPFYYGFSVSRIWAAAAGLILASLAALGLRALERKYCAARTSAFILGFAGMLSFAAVLYAYASAGGSLYEAVGAVSAVYMAGLALGGAAGVYFGPPRLWAFSLLILFALAFAATAAFGPESLTALPAGALLFSDGLFSGGLFSASCAQGSPEDKAELAASLNWLDHLGAALAAALCALVIAPVAGIAGCFAVCCGAMIIPFVMNVRWNIRR